MKKLGKISKIFEQSLLCLHWQCIEQLFFICKKVYVSKVLDEIELPATQNDTYKLVNKLKEEVNDDNITFSRYFDLEVQNDFKTLPIMDSFPKMHKTSTGAKFIVASRKCSTKTLSKAVTKAFRLIFKQTLKVSMNSLIFTITKGFE